MRRRGDGELARGSEGHIEINQPPSSSVENFGDGETARQTTAISSGSQSLPAKRSESLWRVVIEFGTQDFYQF